MNGTSRNRATSQDGSTRLAAMHPQFPSFLQHPLLNTPLSIPVSTERILNPIDTTDPIHPTHPIHPSTKLADNPLQVIIALPRIPFQQHPLHSGNPSLI